MERLRDIIGTLKKHYEKVLVVGCVLLLAFSAWIISSDKRKEAERRQQIATAFQLKPGKPVKPLDAGRFDATLALAKKPPVLSLAKPHHLVSPVTWYRASDGSLVKVRSDDDIGMRKMQVVAIRPLDLSIALIRAATTGSGDQMTVLGYNMIVTNEAASTFRERRISGFYVLNETNKPVFVLRDIKGPPERPTEMVVELKDSEERVSLSADKPFVRTLAYEADLKYGPTGRTFNRKRKGDPIDISGQPHKIVDITASKVVLSDDSNGATCDISLN